MIGSLKLQIRISTGCKVFGGFKRRAEHFTHIVWEISHPLGTSRAMFRHFLGFCGGCCLGGVGSLFRRGSIVNIFSLT